MNDFDIVLTNIISYMIGVFTGLYVGHRVRANNVQQYKLNVEKKLQEERLKGANIFEQQNPNPSINNSPLLVPSAPAFPVQALSLNPDYNTQQKKITVTTE